MWCCYFYEVNPCSWVFNLLAFEIKQNKCNVSALSISSSSVTPSTPAKITFGVINTVDNEVAMTQSKHWKLILLFQFLTPLLSPLYPLCPLLPVCLSISRSLPLHPPALTPTFPASNTKLWSDMRPLPSSPVCNLAQYSPSLTHPLPSPHPSLSLDSGPLVKAIML